MMNHLVIVNSAMVRNSIPVKVNLDSCYTRGFLQEPSKPNLFITLRMDIVR